MLENADSLLERGEDSRDRLVTLLSNLCSVGGRRHLKLLVTSERRLQPGTDARFRSGAEVEAKVERLKFPDDAKLLVENLPRKLTKRDLGLQSCVSAAGLLEAVQEHAVLKEVLRRAGGHPGTLVRWKKYKKVFRLAKPLATMLSECSRSVTRDSTEQRRA